MKITAIEEQKKRKDRLSVFADGQFAFGVHPDVLLDHHLKVGMELDDVKVATVKTDDAFRTSYDKAIGYLSGRPHSAQEVRQYLRDKLIYKHPDYVDLTDSNAKEIFREQQEQSIERIVERLVEQKYVDDAAFAKWWIDNRREFKPRGKRLLLLELKARGVSNADIQAALTTPHEEGHFTGEAEGRHDGMMARWHESGRNADDEVSLAVKASEKYARKYAGLPEREFKQKVGQYLGRKGFDWETIEAAIVALKDQDG